MRDVETVRATLERTAEAISFSIGSVFEDLEKIAGAVTAAAVNARGVPRRSAFHFLKQDLADLSITPA